MKEILTKTNYSDLWYWITNTKKEVWTDEEIFKTILNARFKKIQQCGGLMEKYWINLYRHDEHLRAYVETILGWKVPYKGALSKMINPFSFSERSQRWYFSKFHKYGVFLREPLWEIWSKGGTMGEWTEVGCLDLNYKDYNRIVAKEFRQPVEMWVPQWELQNLPDEYVFSRERINALLAKSHLPWQNELQWENMSFFELYIKYNPYIGQKYYRWKLYFGRKMLSIELTVESELAYRWTQFSIWIETKINNFFIAWKIIDNGDLLNFFVSMGPSPALWYIFHGFLYIATCIMYMYLIELFALKVFYPMIVFMLEILINLYYFIISKNKIKQIKLKYHFNKLFIEKKILDLEIWYINKSLV